MSTNGSLQLGGKSWTEILCDGPPGSVLQTDVFTHTGAIQNAVVPVGATLMNVKSWGGGGGSGGLNATTSGAGGFASGTLPANPVVVVVGGGGQGGSALDNGVGGVSSFGGGGNGGNGFGPAASGSTGGGAGGGLSGVFAGSFSTGNELLIAGGGGGTGGGGAPGDQGGVGGGLNGNDGSGNGQHGLGGTQLSGGLGGISTGPNGSGTNGGSLVGGNGGTGTTPVTSGGGGGGGGGGYFGGGGGAPQGSAGVQPAIDDGEGGGGSGYITPSAIGTSLLSGSGAVPPNTIDPDYIAGVGVGSTVPTGNGGDGLVVIEWLSGVTGSQIEFQRCYSSDPNGVISFVDLDIDGNPYTPIGSVTRCSDGSSATITIPTGATVGPAQALPSIAPNLWTFEVLAIEDGVVQIDFDNFTTAERDLFITLLDDVQNVEEGYYEPQPGIFRHSQSTQYIASENSVTVWIDTNKRLAPWAQAIDPGLETSGDAELLIFASFLGTGPNLGGLFTGTLYAAIPTVADVPLVATYSIDDMNGLEDVTPTHAVAEDCATLAPVPVAWPAGGTDYRVEVVDITDGVVQLELTDIIPSAMPIIIAALDLYASVEEGWIDDGGDLIHTQALTYHQDTPATLTMWFDTNRTLAPWAAECDPGLEASGNSQLLGMSAILDFGPQPGGGGTPILTEVVPINEELPYTASHITNLKDIPHQQLPVEDCATLINCDVTCTGDDPASTAVSGCDGLPDFEIAPSASGGYDLTILHGNSGWATNWLNTWNNNRQLCHEFSLLSGVGLLVMHFFGPGVIGTATNVGPVGCSRVNFTYDPRATRDWLLAQGCDPTDPAVLAQENLMTLFAAGVATGGYDFDTADTNQHRRTLTFTFITQVQEALVSTLCNTRELATAISDAEVVVAPELLCASFDGGATYELGVATTAGWFRVTNTGLQLSPSSVIYDPTGCNCPCDPCAVAPLATLRCDMYSSSFLGQGTVESFPGEPGFVQLTYDDHAISQGCPAGPPNNKWYRVLAWEIDGVDYGPVGPVLANDFATLETWLNSITPGSIIFTLNPGGGPNIQISYPDSVTVRLVIEDGYDDGLGSPCWGVGFGHVIEHDGTPSGAIVDDWVFAGINSASDLASASGSAASATNCVAI